ncbi:hypothetical protein ACFL96_03075 [Thermoproteota archaeon]
MSENKMNKKSQIWISAVLYLLIISIVLVIVLEAGTPIMNNLRDKSVFIRTRDNFVSLDKHITDISNAGPGSQRIVPLEIRKGDLTLGNNQLKWEMSTESAAIQPRSNFEMGSLRIGSDADVIAYETNTSIVLENFYILAVFSKVGNETSYGRINSSGILDYIVYKRTNSTSSGDFNFFVDDFSIDSDGYSKLLDTGYTLGSGTVVYHMNMTGGVVHDLYFTLDSRADYVKVEMV